MLLDTAVDAPCRLVLFSGLAADEAVFAPQQVAFPKLIVPEWIPPNANETLAAYAGRMARPLEHEAPTILGGASFGGIVALHAAMHLKPRAVVLIGSVKTPDELPSLAHLSSPFRRLVAALPVRIAQRCTAPMRWAPVQRRARLLSSLAGQFRQADADVLKWSIQKILEWKKTPEIQCPVFQIHGLSDSWRPRLRSTDQEYQPGHGGAGRWPRHLADTPG